MSRVRLHDDAPVRRTGGKRAPAGAQGRARVRAESGRVQPAAPSRMVRRTALAAGLLLALLALFTAWALNTTPRVVSASPAGATGSSRPTLRIRLAHAADLAPRDVRVSVNGVDVSRRATVDGGRIVVGLAGLGEGRHDVRLRTSPIGLLRRRIDERWTFTVDTTPPPMRIVSPPPSGVQRVGGSRMRIATRTEPGAVVTATSPRAAVRVEAGSNGVADLDVLLAEGRQAVTVVAADEVGNRTRRRVGVRVDSLAPKIGLPPLAALRDPDPVIEGSVVDASATRVFAAIDGREEPVRVERTPTGSLSIAAIGPLAEGSHVLRVSARDSFGHRAEVQRAFLVDSTEELGDRVVGRGARGADVRQLQLLLEQEGLFTPATSRREWGARRYGPRTATAVRRYQAAHAIPSDGVAGADTVAAITLRIVVNRGAHTLTLYRIGTVVRTWGVAVGQPAYPTPTGHFRIVGMQVNPTWTPPDSAWARDAKPIPPGPDNPLGTRWMALDAPGGTVGIHGTNTPSSIGYSLSHGCIRMRSADAEDLYRRVRIGTPVDIVG